MTWTPEQARENARKGGLASAEARRKRREARSGKTAEDRAKEAINGRLEDLVDDLIEAALGEGEFGAHWILSDEEGIEPVYIAGLDSKTRLDAVKTALAYGLGRPTTAKPKEEGEGQPEQTGLKAV